MGSPNLHRLSGSKKARRRAVARGMAMRAAVADDCRTAASAEGVPRRAAASADPAPRPSAGRADNLASLLTGLSEPLGSLDLPDDDPRGVAAARRRRVARRASLSAASAGRAAARAGALAAGTAVAAGRSAAGQAPAGQEGPEGEPEEGGRLQAGSARDALRAVPRNAARVSSSAKRARRARAARRAARSSAAAASKGVAAPAPAGTGLAGRVRRALTIRRARRAAGTAAKGTVLGGARVGLRAGVVAAAAAGALLVATVLIPVLIGGGQEQERLDSAVSGLPSYITSSMVEAALSAQEEYGHPAGCTLAQIIVESGQGDHLSGLATQDNNLFGIKWFSGADEHEEVEGKSDWGTSEFVDGDRVQTTASFIRFASPEACITFRSRVFLQMPRYRDNAYIREAVDRVDSNAMAEGLLDAGWATDPSYVNSLVSVMRAWDLYRFDGMSVEQWRHQSSGITGSGWGQSYADANERQRAIADAAKSAPPTASGLCAAWVSRVYAAAGMGAFRGNACDMYWRWCTSSNKDELKVGMIVAVPTVTGGTPPPYGSQVYGHVGIYVGDGVVMHSTGGEVVSESLDDWLRHFPSSSPAAWGYLGGVTVDQEEEEK